ncbi:TatD family hydrolase [Candidatus Parcubacteria bacterium]|nr:TatD family hydrolase [Candidatus Parcubacteria bacterium]
MLIDTHSHLNFSAYSNDRDSVIRRALENNTQLIIVGSQITTSERAVKIANQYEKGVYAAVGLHPIHLQEFHIDENEIKFNSRAEKFNYDKYKKLAQDKKVAAIGEIGLDYFHLKNRHKEEVSDEREREIKKEQREVFIQQFKMAQDVNLPMIIHCRDAHEDLIEILRRLKSDYPRASGVIHCFNKDLETARKYFDLDFLISFTGLVTFLKGYEWIKEIPDDKFMVETDCPYLTPIPHRGERNEPVYVKYIAQKIAEIRGVSVEKIAEITTQNAKGLFKLP